MRAKEHATRSLFKVFGTREFTAIPHMPGEKGGRVDARFIAIF
jgi:hypothetical protein